MKMRISKIILFNEHGKERTLNFNLNGLNIITGASKTGKSAIAEIISYCFGKKDFSVPAGVIREKVEWYCILLSDGREEIFIGRRKPGFGKKTRHEVYLESASNVEIPSFGDLSPNTNIEGLSSFLSSKLGISENMQEFGEGSTMDPIEAKAKHALTFCIQEQGEIANKFNLFHLQETEWVPNSIRLTLPYFLGAIAEDELYLKNKLQDKRRLLRRAEYELKEAELLHGEGLTVGSSILAEAEEVGLPVKKSTPSSLEELIYLLGELRKYQPTSINVTPGDAITRLEDEREELLNSFYDLREQKKIAQSFVSERGNYGSEVSYQINRLKSLDIISSLSESEKVSPVEEKIRESLEVLTSQLQNVSGSNPRLQGHLRKIDSDIDENKENLRRNKLSLDAALKSRSELQENIDVERKRAEILGKIALYLDSIEVSNDLDGLKNEIERIRQEVLELEEQYKNSNSDAILESQLNLISSHMTNWARELDLEHREARFRLDLKQLTVIADTDTGPIPMKQMGSGANWLGCHLITYFALNKWFSNKNRPVPSFLYLDQPSQVYYPPEDDSEGTENLSDEDRKAVLEMYEWIHKRANEMKSSFQVIITDHVDLKSNGWFQGSIVERWRDGDALIPKDWL